MCPQVRWRGDHGLGGLPPQPVPRPAHQQVRHAFHVPQSLTMAPAFPCPMTQPTIIQPRQADGRLGRGVPEPDALPRGGGQGGAAGGGGGLHHRLPPLHARPGARGGWRFGDVCVWGCGCMCLCFDDVALSTTPAHRAPSGTRSWSWPRPSRRRAPPSSTRASAGTRVRAYAHPHPSRIHTLYPNT